MNYLRSLLMCLIVGASVAAGGFARAQDDDDEGAGQEDTSGGGMEEEGRDTARSSAKKAKPARRVREVVKGFYVRGGIGYLVFLGQLGPVTSGGNAVDLALGGDIIDQPGFTLTVEGDFFQGINNGISNLECGDCGSPVQGDFRSIGGIGRVKFSLNFGGKKIRRGSLYFDVGGGVYFSPSLRTDALGTTDAGVIHSSPAGLVTGGLGLEYYTKLAHFSVGVDASFYVVLGLPVVPMALAVSPFIKYTF
ncbi:adventurous gliding motility protein CglE [Myxococcota bacterium]|nr:adventurous gliding motility protein CglE [Myxococcota bacterium]